MAEFGKITLPGIDDLTKDLDKYDKRVQDEVAAEIQASARTIIRNAKRNAPNDQGRLKQLISQRPIAKLTRELISAAEYSAFVEFGTGRQVRIDHPELFAIAKEFKGAKLTKGKLGFQQAIYEWAERKGIPKELWYSIYRAIIAHGTKANPFFFRAYFEEIEKTRIRIQNILNNTEP